MSDEFETPISEDPQDAIPKSVVSCAAFAKKLYDAKKKLAAELEVAEKAYNTAAEVLIDAMLNSDPPIQSLRTQETGLVFLSKFQKVDPVDDEKAWEKLKEIGCYEGIVKLTANWQTLTNALKDWAKEKGLDLEDGVALLNGKEVGKEDDPEAAKSEETPVSEVFSYFGRPRVGFRA